MKGSLFFGAFALLAFVSCKDIDVPYVPEETYDEAWYAANATISSSDAHFSLTEDGEGVISFKAEGGSVLVYVDCGTEWTADDSGAGVFGCEMQETCITVTAEQNLVEEELYGTITLMTSESKIQFATISITQDARAYITLSEECLRLDKAVSETIVTVESNYEWSYAYESDWFTVSENTDGSLTITVDVNRTGDDREGTVVFTAGDGAANVAETTLTIAQGIEDPDALILEYTITSSNTKIQLPITDITNVKIDWGDGSDVETVTSDWPSHTYSEVGTYTVSISGTVGSLNTVKGGIYISGVKFLTSVIQWGDTGLTSMYFAFENCSNLASLPDGPGPFENVTTFENAFCNCTSLKEVPEDLFKNCTECTTFYGIFEECTSLAVAPTFEGLSKVTDFSWTFHDCSSLTTVPENMFSGCTAVTTFSRCFWSCSSLKELPKGLFDACTEVTSFLLCFRDCSGLTSIQTGLFDNCPSVTTFEEAFYGCTGLTSIQTGLFDNCRAVTSFRWTFYGCSAVSGESPYTEINVNGEAVKVHFYERENYPDYFTAPTSYSNCFTGCTKLDDYDDIPSGWK